MMLPLQEILNKRFGRLVVLAQEPNIRGRHRMVRCKCDCGNETVTRISALLANNTFSCGCYDKEVRIISLNKGRKTRENGAIKNGKVTVEYDAYRKLKARCYNKNNPKYKNYGGRGIIVCNEWLGSGGYKRFLSDMGQRPEHCNSIDRVNVHGNYELSNCRWATIEMQASNKTDTVRLTVYGEEVHQAKLARRIGVS